VARTRKKGGGGRFRQEEEETHGVCKPVIQGERKKFKPFAQNRRPGTGETPKIRVTKKETREQKSTNFPKGKKGVHDHMNLKGPTPQKDERG